MLITLLHRQGGTAGGERCWLDGSCARYARQAVQAHGIVGGAALGERFIREASGGSARKDPIMIQGHRKYADPLSDHDGWLEQ